MGSDLGLLGVFFLVLGAFLAGSIKGSFGVGAGILPVALLSIVFPPDRAVVLLYPVMLVTSLASLTNNWGKWDRYILLYILPSVLVGTVIGTTILVHSPPNILRLLLGVLTLFFVLNEWRLMKKDSVELPEENQSKRSSLVMTLIGIMSGLTSSLAHGGGMIVSMYLVRLKLTKVCFLSTLIACLAINDLLKGFVYGYAGLLSLVDLQIYIITIIVGIIGVKIGAYFLSNVSPDRFKLAILGLLALSGLILIVSFIVSLSFK
jgi:uncharacterized membrane protein YfcA